MELFTERHTAKISGELSCLNRVVISGTIPGICYAGGMSSYLRVKGVRIFYYARWAAEPLRDRIRQNAQALAEQAGLAGGPADGRPAQASVVAPQVGPLCAAVLSTGGAFGQRLYLWKPKTKNRGRKTVSRFSVFTISAGEFLCFFFLSCFYRLLLTFSEFCFGLCGQILKRFNRTDHNGLC